ncbi:MAG: HAMP domain-containing histidine kinase [Calditrichaeota bacterium]|nr:HAMP domain-containing histidine kinase [Calditrichota bacterium]MCB9366381.1 HAMP domain-containing histidine kinase [Calditrichota bacterium]MCB9391989.1 HAMP domain-containing histidine kinase [Calditrichota bacterium]
MLFSGKIQTQYAGTFKGVLFLAALVLVVSVLAYSQYLVNELKDSTRKSLTQKIATYSTLIRSDNPELIGFALRQIQDVEFPIIVTDDKGKPKLWKNIDILPDDTSQKATEELARLVRQMDAQGNPALPILVSETSTDWFHYGDSVVIRQLRWLPWIEVLAAALFVVVGYFGFQNIRRSEERMVWVGMAKETAHQLGTPLTSLMGWIELLKAEERDTHTVSEMERDLARLQRITARFSQIGSKTPLVLTRVRHVIEESADYFRLRLPRSGNLIELEVVSNADPQVKLNAELFSWVLENLIRNSIDAMRSTGGQIRVLCEETPSWIYVDVEDNGAGIPARHRKDVFRPGFTTKKRGWGLGLSLSRRIVEEYHGGRLTIKETTAGKGTTMRIALPRETEQS